MGIDRDIDDATFSDEETGEIWTVGEMRERAMAEDLPKPTPERIMECVTPKPSVGRIVHYRERNECIAAIITRVKIDDVISVVLEYPNETVRRDNLAKGSVPGTWHWPERV